MKRLISDKPTQLDKYFSLVIKSEGSDLHIKGGEKPRIRAGGRLKTTTGDPIPGDKAEELIFELLSPEQKAYFLEYGSLDFALYFLRILPLNIYSRLGLLCLPFVFYP